jgi:fatty-acyl-CoA synthase
MERLVSISGAFDSTSQHGTGTEPFTGLRYGELIERRALRQPHATAILYNEREITYGALYQHIQHMAGFLRSQGVQPGDRVVCLSENRPEILTSLYACARIGAVFTPVGISAPAKEVRYVVHDLAASVLLVSEQAAVVATEALGAGSACKILPLAQQPGEDSLCAQTVVPHPVQAQDPALIVYTSGTSGHPKGVVLSHGALFFNTVNTLLGLDIDGYDTTLVSTPLSHIAALNTVAYATLAKGGKVVLEPRFDAAHCLELISRHGITTMFAVPSMLTLFMQSPGFEKADTSSLRWILGGGAPMPPALVELWSSRNVPVLASYGMTEGGPSISFRRRGDAAGKSESSGTPALLTDIQIIGPLGEELPHGETGEIQVRGPHIATGYWRNGNATDDTFRNGWLATGDRGYLDTDGDLCVTGRSKEIIITGGENVDPAEVEHLIAQFPGIIEAAVVGRPDPVWGEVITAVIVAENELQLSDLQEFLKPHLARFKLPRQLEMRAELPRNPVGKLLRRELQAIPQEQG